MSWRTAPANDTAPRWKASVAISSSCSIARPTSSRATASHAPARSTSIPIIWAGCSPNRRSSAQARSASSTAPARTLACTIPATAQRCGPRERSQPNAAADSAKNADASATRPRINSVRPSTSEQYACPLRCPCSTLTAWASRARSSDAVNSPASLDASACTTRWMPGSDMPNSAVTAEPSRTPARRAPWRRHSDRRARGTPRRRSPLSRTRGPASTRRPDRRRVRARRRSCPASRRSRPVRIGPRHATRRPAPPSRRRAGAVPRSRVPEAPERRDRSLDPEHRAIGIGGFAPEFGEESCRPLGLSQPDEGLTDHDRRIDATELAACAASSMASHSLRSYRARRAARTMSSVTGVPPARSCQVAARTMSSRRRIGVISNMASNRRWRIDERDAVRRRRATSPKIGWVIRTSRRIPSATTSTSPHRSAPSSASGSTSRSSSANGIGSPSATSSTTCCWAGSSSSMTQRDQLVQPARVRILDELPHAVDALERPVGQRRAEQLVQEERRSFGETPESVERHSIDRSRQHRLDQLVVCAAIERPEVDTGCVVVLPEQGDGSRHGPR
jgi:hypothetical protein